MKFPTHETKPPANIHCLALNYPGVSGTSASDSPLYFVKSASCFTLSGAAIMAPTWGGRFWTECELGIVVAKSCSGINPEDAWKYIRGFVVCGDLTCENISGRDHHLAFSKSRSGFCPVSSEITMLAETDLKDAWLETYINGELKQRGRLADAKLGVMQALAYVSSITSLNAGDLILTGTPLGWENCMLTSGDLVRQCITGLADLEYSILEAGNG